jgi:DNA-binding transcriptional LysR family regulator
MTDDSRWTGRIGRQIKLRDLHILLAVANCGSMGKAATRLAVSQPVVSKAVADLERVLAVRLFERSQRGVEPTAHGRALLRCGLAVFDELQQGVKALEFISDPTAGELRLGCTEPLAAGFVGAVIEQLSEKYPRVSFQVVTGDPASLQERELRQRRIELAVSPIERNVLTGDVDAEVLFDDRQVIVVGKHSRWARRRQVMLAALMQEPWLLPPPDTVIGGQISSAFRAAGIEPPRTQVESFSIPLCQHLVASGRFITMLPASMVTRGTHLPLTFLRLQAPTVPRPTGVIGLRGRTRSALAEIFIEHARRIAEPLTRLK